ncbi:MAG: pilus assembly PilX N-terminal domain-containing protein [Acidobacteriota bacterium]
MNPETTTSTRTQAERGSAFFVAMVVLGVLSLIGLSLALVTDTEMLLGGNERVVNETFFAAEAGVTTMISKLLVTNSIEAVDLVLPSYYGELIENTQLGFDVRTTGLLPVIQETLPYTTANEGTAQFSSFYYYGLVRAQRTGWRSSKAVPDCDDLERSISSERHIFHGFYYGPVPDLQANELIEFERNGLDQSSAEDLCEFDNIGTFDNSRQDTGRAGVLRQSSGNKALY